VRKDSGITKVTDLKGKVIGTNGGGSAIDVAIRAMLKKHGLEEKRDYTMLEGPLPAMPAMLLEKKADLIPAVLPFSFNPKLREEGKVLFEQREVLGITQMIVWTASRSSTKSRRHDRFQGGRAVCWYPDPKNHAEVAQIASRCKCRRAVRLAFSKPDLSRSNLIPNVEALRQCRHPGPRLREKKIDIKIRRSEPSAGSDKQLK
jgi:NitT/TauT family transport system substrate-binding protein